MTTNSAHSSSNPRISDSAASNLNRDAIIKAGGCIRCKLLPSSPGWYAHLPATCRGDATRNIPPSRELRGLSVKKEITAAVLPSSVLTDEQFGPDDFDDVDPATVAAVLPTAKLTYADLDWSESDSDSV